jgi:maltokinase
MTSSSDDHGETRSISPMHQAYLTNQRWFGGKGRGFEVRAVHELSWLSEPPGAGEWPVTRVELIELGYEDGDLETYQVPVAYYPEKQDRLEHAYIGEVENQQLGRAFAYDALHDRSATVYWLRGIIDERVTPDARFSRLETGDELTEEPSLALTAEQSNTSLVYGEQSLLKVFRKVADGRNPDIEIHQALTLDGCDKVAALLGWMSGRWTNASGKSVTADLAMLQRFLRTASNGWELALTSVRDLMAEGDLHADEVGGDFAGESERLGATTGEVHAELAKLFATARWSTPQLSELANQMTARLVATVAAVPQLKPYAPALRGIFDDVRGLAGPVPVQRVHGDLHLGQTMRTVRGWKLIDFEGEPAKPLAGRVALDSPLRDIAAMLRSFDYAAQSMTTHPNAHDQAAFRAVEWAGRNRGAFLDGYAALTGTDPRDQQSLLLAYEMDKAVYESMYESRNRPSWLPIPLGSIERQLADPVAEVDA